MQDIYKQRGNWKIILAVLGTVIFIITLIYSNYLAKKLEENEIRNAKLYTEAIKKLANIDTDINRDVQTEQDIIDHFSQPVIIKGEAGVLSGFNFTPDQDTNQAFLKSKIKNYLSQGKKPVKGTGYAQEIYFFNTKLLTYITWYPLLQLILVGSFVGLGYVIFNSSRRAEQNRVWAGMAKETAHQLGTPISAIMGWIANLKELYGHDDTIREVTEELEKDVDRLNLVADRFSKIGSQPDLKDTNLHHTLTTVMDYMSRRASKSISFDLQGNKDIIAKINPHLFEWVIENLMRNSLDAMSGKGKISVTLYQLEGNTYVDIKDTGKGIPASRFKTVFNPGYSTKQRGWGLGLSLAKRIIEEYHKGKIYVKESKIDEGSTFTIRLQ